MSEIIQTELQLQFRNACTVGRLTEVQRSCQLHSWDELCRAGENPLRIAADDGDEMLCEVLLDHGAPVNGFDKGHAPLHSAAMMGRTPVCYLLWSSGADLDLPRPCDGRLAEQLALEADRSETVHFFRAIRAAEAAHKALSEISVELTGSP